MEIRIGIQNIAREIALESDLTADQIKKLIDAALAGPVLELTRSNGGRVVVPTAAIGYIEIGAEEKRRVGFGA